MERKTKQLQGAATEVEAARQKVAEGDQLLSALYLVIKANVEYAKGVTDLISSDLERDDKLDEIRSELTKLTTKTEQLIDSQHVLLHAINTRSEEDQKYLDRKLGPLYKDAGLKEDGTEYSPADRWVLTMQKALQSKLVALIAGALLFWLGKIIYNGVAGTTGFFR